MCERLKTAAAAGGKPAELDGTVLHRCGRPSLTQLARSYGWLNGLGINVVLAVFYLFLVPLTGVSHGNWAIPIGSYFAGFIFADSATTNIFGADMGRVRQRLADGTSLHRILLIKNLTLMLIVGLPILIATAVLTLQEEPSDRLAVTIPAVLWPILAWLGLGNLVSVLLPVRVIPLRRRWQQRRNLRLSCRWLLMVVLPYGLCLVVDPLSDTPMVIFHALGAVPGTSVAWLACLLVAAALISYLSFTAAALTIIRTHGLRLHEPLNSRPHQCPGSDAGLVALCWTSQGGSDNPP
ncbi:MAG: hypothetical protein M3Y49_08065 [Actinomycetota bacterium]|nr:hypothetical protein [Actinomycetota bacterium]